MDTLFEKCIVVADAKYLPKSQHPIELEKLLKEDNFDLLVETESISVYSAPEKYRGDKTFLLIFNGNRLIKNMENSKPYR